MKTIVISDLHGYLIDITEPFDLLIICGDSEPVWYHSRLTHSLWLNTTFAEWVNDIPFKDDESRVIMIAGNHSFYLEHLSKTKREKWLSNIHDQRLVYLDDEEYTFKNKGKEYKIFGCPYCQLSKGWPFCREDLHGHYDKIPNNLDILVTHDAPDILNAGVSTEGRCKGKNFGNKVLAEYVEKCKPKYYFFGHIHSSPLKTITEYHGTKVVNASILNEDYQIYYKPIILDI